MIFLKIFTNLLTPEDILLSLIDPEILLVKRLFGPSFERWSTKSGEGHKCDQVWSWFNGLYNNVEYWASNLQVMIPWKSLQKCFPLSASWWAVQEQNPIWKKAYLAHHEKLNSCDQTCSSFNALQNRVLMFLD